MQMELGAAALIGLGVALVLMYVVLRKYTYPAVEQPFFSDPTLFTLFAVGLVEGTVVLLVFTYAMLDAIIAKNLMSVIIVVCFGIIIELLLLVTLNLKRFAGKSDTIFYGFGLGIGSGAAMATGLVYFFGAYLTKLGSDVGSWVFIIITMLLFLFLSAATGLIIGEGVARYRSFEFFLKGLMFECIGLLVFVGSLSIIPSDLFVLTYVILLIDLAFACYLLYIGAFRNLPNIVDDVIKQEKKIQEMNAQNFRKQ